MIAWADLSYADVAAAAGIPVGTVRSRLNRARTRIRPASSRPASRAFVPASRARQAASYPGRTLARIREPPFYAAWP